VKPPLNIDEFTKISPLVRGYELRPDRSYLIVCDGKDFKQGLAERLMQDIRQMHPDVNIAIVATLKPKSIEVREKTDEEKSGSADTVSGTTTPENP
jgi:hypothetical protein